MRLRATSCSSSPLLALGAMLRCGVAPGRYDVSLMHAARRPLGSSRTAGEPIRRRSRGRSAETSAATGIRGRSSGARRPSSRAPDRERRVRRDGSSPPRRTRPSAATRSGEPSAPATGCDGWSTTGRHVSYPEARVVPQRFAEFCTPWASCWDAARASPIRVRREPASAADRASKCPSARAQAAMLRWTRRRQLPDPRPSPGGSRSTRRGSGSPMPTRPSSPSADRVAAATRRAARGRADPQLRRHRRGGGIAQVGVVVDGRPRLARPAIDRRAHDARRPYTVTVPCPLSARHDPRPRHRHPPQRPARGPGLGHRRRRQRDALGSRRRDDPQRLAAERSWARAGS